MDESFGLQPARRDRGALIPACHDVCPSEMADFCVDTRASISSAYCRRDHANVSKAQFASAGSV